MLLFTHFIHFYNSTFSFKILIKNNVEPLKWKSQAILADFSIDVSRNYLINKHDSFWRELGICELDKWRMALYQNLRFRNKKTLNILLSARTWPNVR